MCTVGECDRTSFKPIKRSSKLALLCSKILVDHLVFQKLSGFWRGDKCDVDQVSEEN